MSKTSFQSQLGPVIDRYVSLRQALGRQCTSERYVFRHLDRFLTAGGGDLDNAKFAAWCDAQRHVSSGVRAWRMRVVRNLCLYRRRTEPACFVPDHTLFPAPHRPVRPHIFTEDEIGRLLQSAAELSPTGGSPLRPQVYRLAVVLLYTAGLRRRELLRLTVGDYHPGEHSLLVRASKFHKSRLLPLSVDASREVDSYLDARRRHGPVLRSDLPLLCNQYVSGGRAYSGGGIGEGLRALLRSACIRTSAGRTPRVHDLRHTFAVHALLRWYRSGADVQSKLPFLAAYMGHVSVVSTEYYLSLVPQLAECASERFARHCGGLVSALSGDEP